MTKFTVKEREEGKPCFVCEEESRVYFEIVLPADLERSGEIARFLNSNIREVVVDRQLEDYVMGKPKGGSHE